MSTITYRRGQELPGLTFPWTDSAGVALPLNTGHTFVLELVNTRTGITSIPNCTITGASGSVNVAWAANALDIAAGIYRVWLTATETASGKQRVFNPGKPPSILIV